MRKEMIILFFFINLTLPVMSLASESISISKDFDTTYHYNSVLPSWSQNLTFTNLASLTSLVDTLTYQLKNSAQLTWTVTFDNNPNDSITKSIDLTKSGSGDYYSIVNSSNISTLRLDLYNALGLSGFTGNTLTIYFALSDKVITNGNINNTLTLYKNTLTASYNTSPVPIPGTALLLGSGLLGLVGIGSRKKRE